MKKIPFYKMQGSGNDFILIDDRKGILRGKSLKGLARTVCDRHYSVGADGLIMIVPPSSRKIADFGWRFFNADGSEAAMCGNGSRCAARFAFINKIAKKTMAFETLAGIIRAEVKAGTVKVQLTPAGSLRQNISIPFEGGARMGHFINTGVPHVVYLSDDLAAEDVEGIGRRTRYHDLFKPAGTNVNFIQVRGKHKLSIRTYERGVEGETLACGTGSVAATLVAGSLRMVASPVQVTTRSGEKLTVTFEGDTEAGWAIYLEGEAKVICEGVLHV